MTAGRGRWTRVITASVLAATALALTVSALSDRAPAAEVAREPTPEELRVLHDAEQLLVQRCMREAGFEYWPEPKETAGRTFPYVVDDAGWARLHGYGAEEHRQASAAAEHNPNRRYIAGLPAERRSAATVALNGPSPEGLEARLPNGLLVRHSDRGCVSYARRALYRDLASWFRVTKVADNLAGLRAGLVTADPRFTAAARRWSDCMRGAGHHYRNPTELHARILDDRRPLPRPDEIKLVVAEAECAGTSGLAAVARDLDRHYGETVRHRSRADLEDRRRLQSRALPRAREIVRGHPTTTKGRS